MEGKNRGGKAASFVSGLCVLAALAMLLHVCSYCYPTVQKRMGELFVGTENGPVRQAFGTLVEGLEKGEPVRETFSRSVQILIHEKG